MSDDERSLRQPVDEDARRLARRLMRASRHAALATLDPASGAPAASRVAVATDFAGEAVILVSGLSAHTPALIADPRCSLLLGEPGKGDPLASPRLTLFAAAEPFEAGSQDASEVRQRFLARHPKASLYVDFPDFRFFRLRAGGRASMAASPGRSSSPAPTSSTKPQTSSSRTRRSALTVT